MRDPNAADLSEPLRAFPHQLAVRPPAKSRPKRHLLLFPKTRLRRAAGEAR